MEVGSLRPLTGYLAIADLYMHDVVTLLTVQEMAMQVTHLTCRAHQGLAICEFLPQTFDANECIIKLDPGEGAHERGYQITILSSMGNALYSMNYVMYHRIQT